MDQVDKVKDRIEEMRESDNKFIRRLSGSPALCPPHHSYNFDFRRGDASKDIVPVSVQEE